jgi:hypothetical protein
VWAIVRVLQQPRATAKADFFILFLNSKQNTTRYAFSVKRVIPGTNVITPLLASITGLFDEFCIINSITTDD